jgi:hypothetical protein
VQGAPEHVNRASCAHMRLLKLAREVLDHAASCIRPGITSDELGEGSSLASYTRKWLKEVVQMELCTRLALSARHIRPL